MEVTNHEENRYSRVVHVSGSAPLRPGPDIGLPARDLEGLPTMSIEGMNRTWNELDDVGRLKLVLVDVEAGHFESARDWLLRDSSRYASFIAQASKVLDEEALLKTMLKNQIRWLHGAERALEAREEDRRRVSREALQAEIDVHQEQIDERQDLIDNLN